MLSFHKVASLDEELLKLLLLAMQMDPRTPAERAKCEKHYICSLHFNLYDFDGRNTKLKPNAFQTAGSFAKSK